MKHVIYKVTNPLNGMVYIGVTKSNIRTRWIQHTARARKGAKSSLHEAIRYYGSAVFHIEEICSCTSRENACAVEQMAIQDYNCMYPRGYNMTTGGEHGSRWNQESVDKQIKKLTAYFSSNPQARDIIRQQQIERCQDPVYLARMSVAARQYASTTAGLERARKGQSACAAVKREKREQRLRDGTASRYQIAQALIESRKSMSKSERAAWISKRLIESGAGHRPTVVSA